MLFLSWRKCVTETQPYSNGWVSTGNVCEFAIRAGPQRGRKVFPQERAHLREGTQSQVSQVRKNSLKELQVPLVPVSKLIKKSLGKGNPHPAHRLEGQKEARRTFAFGNLYFAFRQTEGMESPVFDHLWLKSPLELE